MLDGTESCKWSSRVSFVLFETISVSKQNRLSDASVGSFSKLG